MKSHRLFVLSALTIAASLTACGGGGGGDATQQTSTAIQVPAPVVVAPAPVAPAPVVVAPAPVVPVVLTNSLVTSVPAPTYAAGTEELAAFNLLNAERGACGFGLLAQNGAIDSAAQRHSDYQILNNVITHVQNQQTMPTGFTGTTVVDRLIAAKYIVSDADRASTYEAIVSSGTSTKNGQGALGVRGLMNAPYHMISMFSETRDVGIALRNNADNNITTPGNYATFDFSSKFSAGNQLPDSSAVRTYPCNGTTGVVRLLAGEIPNPVPGRNLSLNPLGSSVYINVLKGNTIAINTVSFVNVATGASVVTRLPITEKNDPNGSFRSHEAYIAADAPLDKSAKYRVMITGTNNGVAFSKDFVFTASAD